MTKFETDLSLLYYFFRMRIVQSEHVIFINKKKYALALLEKFGLKDCKHISIPLVVNDESIKLPPPSRKITRWIFQFRILNGVLWFCGGIHSWKWRLTFQFLYTSLSNDNCQLSGCWKVLLNMKLASPELILYDSYQFKLGIVLEMDFLKHRIFRLNI